MRTRSWIPLALLLAAGTALAQYGDISDLKLNKPEDKVDVKSTPPPEGAVVLFDGKGLDGWVKADGRSHAKWPVEDGILSVGAGQGSIMTERRFGDVRLHVEFNVPYLPDRKGQARGNSGVYVHGHYEVQILNSFGKEAVTQEDAGALYRFAPPLVSLVGLWYAWRRRRHADGSAEAKPHAASRRFSVPSCASARSRFRLAGWLRASDAAARSRCNHATAPSPPSSSPVRTASG